MKEVKIKQKRSLFVFFTVIDARAEGGSLKCVFYLLLATWTNTSINLDKIHEYVATIAWIKSNAPKAPKTLL